MPERDKTQELVNQLSKQLANGGIHQASVLRPRPDGGYDWLGIFEKYGVATVGLVAVGYVLFFHFIVPMQEANDRMIDTNIKSQEALIENQKALNDAVKANVDELRQHRTFMSKVERVHEEQVAATREIGDTMTRAEKVMAPVPEERRAFYRDQKTLLTEIRDRLPQGGG